MTRRPERDSVQRDLAERHVALGRAASAASARATAREDVTR